MAAWFRFLLKPVGSPCLYADTGPGMSNKDSVIKFTLIIRTILLSTRESIWEMNQRTHGEALPDLVRDVFYGYMGYR